MQIRDSMGRFAKSAFMRKTIGFGVLVIIVYLAYIQAVIVTTNAIYTYFYGSLFLK